MNDTAFPVTRRRFHRLLAGGVAAGLAGCATGTGTTGMPAGDWPVPSLDSLARAKGIRFGNAMGLLASGSRQGSRFHDLRYRALMAHECSVIVCENETKWHEIRPDPRRPYDFSAADEMFRWAQGRGMALRGHTLVWCDPKWLPPWLLTMDWGARPAQAMDRVLSEHVAAVCRHFGRSIESWDVANEAIDPATGDARVNVFTQALGGVPHLARLFELAREHAPHAQLVYNDYMNWGSSAEPTRHRAGVLKLLAALKARGAPVQALGLQGHIGFWTSPEMPTAAEVTEWRRFLDEVAGMGLKLLVTEFDVHDLALPPDAALRDARVAAVAREWLDVTLAQPGLDRLLCWGMADHYNWLQDFQPRPDGLAKRVAPYDDQLRPKPLREAIAAALRATPARPAA